jgi:hypothetical protein
MILILFNIIFQSKPPWRVKNSNVPIILKLVPQQFFCAKHMGLYRINRESGYHLDLLVGPVVKKEKVYAYTVPFGQFPHGTQHRLSGRGAEQAPFRGIPVNHLIFPGKTPEFLLSGYIIYRSIIGNLIKPCRKTGTALKIGQIPVSLEEYLLGKIRGVFSVTQETHTHTVNGPFVPFNQMTETIFLPGNDAGDNYLVVFSRSRRIMSRQRTPAAFNRNVSGHTLLFGPRIAHDNFIPQGRMAAQLNRTGKEIS